MDLSHVVACGLFLALLALGLEAKPAPRHLPKGPSPGSAVALGRQLAELLEAPSGAARGGGGTKAAAAAAGAQQQQQQPAAAAPRGKGSSPASSQRLLRDLRTDARQARRAWGRLLPSEHHGGGGGGGSRRQKGTNPRKGQSRGCFGLKLDRIGSMSGLGC